MRKRIVVERIRNVGIDCGRKALAELRRREGRVGSSFERFVDHAIRRDRGSEKTRCNAGHRGRANGVAALARHSRRGSNADRFVIATEAVAHAAHQHRNIGALAPPIGVKLVEHEKVEPVRVVHDSTIKRVLPRHQQFEHHEIREQDVRLGLADTLPFVRALLAGITRIGRTQLVR